MRILWMKPILPYPPHQGTRRVTLQLLTHLSGDHEIRLFCRGLGPADAGHARELEAHVPGLGVRLEPAPNRRSAAHRAWYRAASRIAAARGVPPIEFYTALPALLDAFRAEHAAFRPDLTVVEYWYAFPYLEAVAPAPAVLFAHDVEVRVRDGAGDLARDPGRGGGLGRLEVERERRALTRAPRIWFLTEGDREAAVRLGVDPGRASVMPYGTPLPEAAGAEPEDRAPHRVLLFGSFLADFNRDALEYTLDAVWPAVRRLRPDAILEVAGGGLGDALRHRCVAAGARVRGEVADVSALLRESAVVLVPLRFGGGLRIRLLEALALGRTVVGTPVGVLGMGPRADREVLVGETPDELAGQVARALGDPALRAALGRAGKEWIAAHHAMDVVRARQKELVLDTARRLGGAGSGRQGGGS